MRLRLLCSIVLGGTFIGGIAHAMQQLTTASFSGNFVKGLSKVLFFWVFIGINSLILIVGGFGRFKF